jgi:hypothetical protein
MWGWTVLERLWTAAVDPAADAADAPRTIVEKTTRVLRVAAHRMRRQVPRLALLGARGVRRIPRTLLRNLRHARYYVATVVLQRQAKNGRNRA